MVWAIYFLLTMVASAAVSRFQLANLHLAPQERTFVAGDPKITHKVIFSIDQNGQNLGELHLGLFGDIVPVTVKNFVHLANETYGFGYKDNIFHRVIENFMVQAGDLKTTDKKSIYNNFGSFDDEHFELIHDKVGRVSMANAGPNTNGAGFFVTVAEYCGHLDGKHVVFGQLMGGLETLMRMNMVEVDGSTPINPLSISNIAIFDYFPKVIVDVSDSPSLLYFLFYIILIGGAIYGYLRWFYRRQYFLDIKDGNYY